MTKIKMRQHCILKGKHVRPGDVVEVSDREAFDLTRRNVATIVEERAVETQPEREERDDE